MIMKQSRQKTKKYKDGGKINDTEFALGSISPIFAASKILEGDANIGDFGLIGGFNRFVNREDKAPQDPSNLTPEERTQLRAMLASQGQTPPPGMKRGGLVKKMAKGGMTRGDGCATRGKTKGRMV